MWLTRWGTLQVMTASALRTAPLGRVLGFLPALEGLRGLAALGIVTTHVAFQTATVHPAWLGRALGRLDLAVAVFFALSGFLLWRPHAAAARGVGQAHPLLRYWLLRAARILPAYWLCVTLVLLFLPAPAGHSWQTWLANLGLAQVFVPLSLTDGLTQMWSLSVEVAFYLLLPLFAWAMAGLRAERARARIPVLAGVSVVALGWAWLPVPTPAHIHHTNWLPGYLPWFAAGMVLAELVTERTVRPQAFARFAAVLARRRLMLAVAAVCFVLACTPLAGPPGLADPSSAQYATKIALGALIGLALLGPLVLAPASSYRYLTSAVGLAVGRWSYGVFVWHLAVLAMIFPMLQVPMFGGHFFLVWGSTVVITLCVAAASYALVEEPSRKWIQGVRGV